MIQSYISRGAHFINREDAVTVLRELGKLQEFVFSQLVEINTKPEGAEVKIKCVLDAHSRKVINEFLEKRNLKIREEKGFVIIFE